MSDSGNESGPYVCISPLYVAETTDEEIRNSSSGEELPPIVIQMPPPPEVPEPAPVGLVEEVKAKV